MKKKMEIVCVKQGKRRRTPTGETGGGKGRRRGEEKRMVELNIFAVAVVELEGGRWREGIRSSGPHLPLLPL